MQQSRTLILSAVIFIGSLLKYKKKQKKDGVFSSISRGRNQNQLLQKNAEEKREVS